MRQHYSPAQQTLHWLTVALMLCILTVAWVLISVTEESTKFFFWMDAHESIGLAIFFLTALRIVWRVFDPAPTYPRSVRPWSRRFALLAHLGLLGAMIVMPVSGFLWATHTRCPLLA
jgi:cytochrome b561